MTNTVEIRLKADGSGLIRTFKVSTEQAEKLNRELGNSPAQADRASRSFANLNRRAGELAETSGRVGRSMSVMLTLPLLAAGGAAAKLAIDAQETANKFDVVFGPAAERARARLQSLADTVPLTVAQMEGLSSGIQDMLVPMGLARDRAAELSVDMVALAGDLASFNNTDPAMVLEAFQSALAGSSEPLRRYGVDVREARLQTLAYEQGLVQQGQEMDAAARAQAVLIAITRDSADAQGDAARTAGEAANQIKFLQRDVRQLAEDLGTMLIPAVSDLVAGARAGIAVISELDEETQRWALGVGAVVAATGPLLVGLSILITSLRNVLPLLRRVASTKALLATAVAGVTFAIVEGARRFSRYDANVAKFARTLDTRATPAVERFSDAHIRMLNEMHELPTSVEALEAELASAEQQLRRFTRQYGENSVAARSAADRVEQLTEQLQTMGVTTTETTQHTNELAASISRQLREALIAAKEAYAEVLREGADFMDQIEDLAAELQGPIAVAFRQYNDDLERATLLHQQGALSADQFGRAQEVLAQRLQSQVLPAMQGLMQQMLDIATFNFGGSSSTPGAASPGSAAADLARGLSLAISSSQGAGIGESIGNAIKTFGTAGIQEGLQDALTSAFEGMELDDAEMQVAFLAIGEAIGGNIGAAVGTAVGATIGAILGAGSGSPLGMQIGAMIGNAVGSLFDRQKDPILQTAGRSGFTRDPEEARRRGDVLDTDLGEVFFRFRNISDEAAGTLKRALRQFDSVLADLIGEDFIAEAQAALEGFQTESQDMGAIMQQRFNIIVGVLDEFTRNLTLEGETLEAQMQRLADIIRTQARFEIGDTMGSDDSDMVIWLAAELARAGETIADSFQRLLDISTALDTAMGLTGNSISSSRAEVIRFSDALVKAFGDDLQRLTRGLDRIFQTFFSQEEILTQQAATARSRATDLLTALGLDVTDEMLTTEGFRQIFDDLFGTLTPEMTAILIEAGDAVADLIEAEAGLTGLRQDNTEATTDNTLALEENTRAAAEAARAERERAQSLRDMLGEIDRELLRFASPTMAAYQDLRDAQAQQLMQLSDLGASEMQLARARELHSMQLRRFTADLETSILTLADQLFGEQPQQIQTSEAIGNAANSMRDQIIRALQGVEDWLNRSLLSDISPLTPQQRLNEAEDQFRAQFARAMAGDADALSALPSAADALLSEASGFFGTSTSQYGAIFDRVREMMSQVSAIRPPAEAMAPPTAAQVGRIETQTSAFREALEEMERVQAAWRLAEQLSALARISEGGSAFQIAERLGFTNTNMREILGLIGADVGDELEGSFNEVLAGLSGQDPMLSSIDRHAEESNRELREIRTEMIGMRGDLARLLAEGNADRRAAIRVSQEGLQEVAEQERQTRSAMIRDGRPTDTRRRVT